MRFQLETLREGIVQSLSVLGQLKGGIIFVFWRDRRFTDSKNYSYLPRYLSKKKTILACLTLSINLEEQPNMLTHMLWEPQKLYCYFSLMIY